MDQPQQVNIPAFQRKRSIVRRAKRSRIYEETKPARTRKIKTRKRPVKESFEPLTELPLTSAFPSENLFSEPLLDEMPKPGNSKVVEMQACGICEGYFDKIEVAIVKLTKPLREGDLIIFEKQDGLFQQPVKSMQINRKDVKLAHTGSDIGLKVALKPQVGTPVYKVI